MTRGSRFAPSEGGRADRSGRSDPATADSNGASPSEEARGPGAFHLAPRGLADRAGRGARRLERAASPAAARRPPSPDELLFGAKAREAGRGRSLGPCPICGRPMVEGASVDRHHLVPRSRGGRETVFLHRICHRKLHVLWSEVELARLFHDVETIRAHPEIRRFVAWLRNKPATFWAPTRRARRGPSR